MTQMLGRDDIGKIVEIEWFDPRSEARVSLENFKNNPYFLLKTIGKVRFISDTCIILSHESCVEDNEEDLTSIHPALVNLISYKDKT